MFQYFQTKWSKSEEKLNFEGRWVWVAINPSPNQSFVATHLAQGKAALSCKRLLPSGRKLRQWSSLAQLCQTPTSAYATSNRGVEGRNTFHRLAMC